MKAGLSKLQTFCAVFSCVYSFNAPEDLNAILYSPFQISDTKTEKGYSNYPEPGFGTNYYYMHSTF